MKKHLFLEGQIRTGKSTLLRDCLRPYRDNIGGFCSQRLIDENGEAFAYRITDAGILDVEASYSPYLEHIFAIRSDKGAQKDMEVFEKCGVKLLKEARKKNLILLDEIGGSELLVPAFRDELYNVLGGDIPCIGVIKLNEKAKFMSREAGYPGIVADLNAQLRKDLIRRFDARIIPFDESSKRDIEEFICGKLMTL
ncbi:MAG: hypothetical protein GX578_00235 [Clostridiales bacterium]|jgi:nucleoside-triphosphatase|nr:hypothetical protein [Clostridiales bacterium]